jgi:NhaA family Na+:H+ antiporter
MMAVLAMWWANSPLAYLHQGFIDASLFWINDGLMAIFFLVVGLELKRGYLDGHLSSFSQAALPAAAAVGGMVVPALIYYLINKHDTAAVHGWATPVATDIAFALGVLSLLGKRVPAALKLFLMALAIFDDLGAIILIALFFSHELVPSLLFQAVLLVAMLFALNRMNVQSLIPYVLFGVLLWGCLLFAGIHPTIAGVILALMIPANATEAKSPLHRMEEMLHPWAAYFIMPLFALANAGFPLAELDFAAATSSVVVGIVAGLFLGKQLGVFGFSWLILKTKWAKFPANCGWLELYGVALLCGIGFTMSLFLGTLSFQNENAIYLAEVRLGVIAGSLLSGLVGGLVLMLALIGKNKIHRSKNR